MDIIVSVEQSVFLVVLRKHSFCMYICNTFSDINLKKSTKITTMIEKNIHVHPYVLKTNIQTLHLTNRNVIHFELDVRSIIPIVIDLRKKMATSTETLFFSEGDHKQLKVDLEMSLC